MSDLNPLETREWLDALDSVVVFDGAERTTFLLDELLKAPAATARRYRTRPIPLLLNTIPPVRETPHPGDQEIEYKIRSLIGWKGDPVGGVRRPRGGPGSGSLRTRRRPPA
jgi:pyruvate dehydrogenase E1 component